MLVTADGLVFFTYRLSGMGRRMSRRLAREIALRALRLSRPGVDRQRALETVVAVLVLTVASRGVLLRARYQKFTDSDRLT